MVTLSSTVLNAFVVQVFWSHFLFRDVKRVGKTIGNSLLLTRIIYNIDNSLIISCKDTSLEKVSKNSCIFVLTLNLSSHLIHLLLHLSHLCNLLIDLVLSLSVKFFLLFNFKLRSPSFSISLEQVIGCTLLD